MKVLGLIKSITWPLNLKAGNKDVSAVSVDSFTELP